MGFSKPFNYEKKKLRNLFLRTTYGSARVLTCVRVCMYMWDISVCINLLAILYSVIIHFNHANAHLVVQMGVGGGCNPSPFLHPFPPNSHAQGI